MKELGFGLIFATLPFTASSQSFGFDAREICQEAMKPGFEQLMTYMGGGGETCKQQTCNTQQAIFGDRVYVEAWQSADSQNNLLEQVGRFVDESTSVISGITGIRFDASFQEADSFVFILILSPRDIARVYSGAFENIDPNQFQHYILPALAQKKCAGIVTQVAGDDFDLISKVLIFVPDSLKSDKEVKSCIFEEVMNSTGLYRDPAGQASLFDNENYKAIGDSVHYSSATLSMLSLHYMIATGAYTDVSDFLERACLKN